MITVNEVKKHLEIANEIMVDNICDYTPIKFTDIKISKARTFLGKIHRTKNYLANTYEYKLKVSGPIFNSFKTEEAMKNQLISTLIHELIHTCPGCFNHGTYFKQNCYIINFNTKNKYHVSTREDLYHNEEFNYEKLNELKPRRKTKKGVPYFEIYCPDCKRVVARRYTNCRLIKHPEEYYCKCGCNKLIVTKKEN